MEQRSLAAKLELERQSAAAKLALDQEDRNYKRAAEAEKQQMGAHLSQQNGALAEAVQAVAAATAAASKPRRSTVERDSRGNMIGSRSEVEDNE